jgi:hypothetical protein
MEPILDPDEQAMRDWWEAHGNGTLNPSLLGAHYRCVTPYTDPDRFTEEEKALFDQGKCPWQTAYGLPGTEYCGKPSKSGASFGHCDEHDEEMAEGYYPDGSRLPYCPDDGPSWRYPER